MQNHRCMDNSSRISFPGINRKGIIILYIILANTSCINYYKVNSSKEITAEDRKSLLYPSKQVIVHLKDTSCALKNVSINNNVLAGKLIVLGDREVKYLHPSSGSRNHYRSSDARFIFNQVHLYAEGIEVPDNRQVSIPMDMISKVDIYQKNKGATIASHLLGTGMALVLTSLLS